MSVTGDAVSQERHLDLIADRHNEWDSDAPSLRKVDEQHPRIKCRYAYGNDGLMQLKPIRFRLWLVNAPVKAQGGGHEGCPQANSD
jgi:hypothetical protein